MWPKRKCGQNANVAKMQMLPERKCFQNAIVAKTQKYAKRKSRKKNKQFFPKLEIELDMARNYLKLPEYLELAGNGWK